MEKNLRTFSRALFFLSSFAGNSCTCVHFVLFPSGMQHIADVATLCGSCVSIRSGHASYFLQRSAIYTTWYTLISLAPYVTCGQSFTRIWWMLALLDKTTVAPDVSLPGIRILFNAHLCLRHLGLTSFKSMKVNIRMIFYVIIIIRSIVPLGT